MKKTLVFALLIVLGLSVLFTGCGGNAPKSRPANTNNMPKVVKGKTNETVTLPGDTSLTVQRVLRNPEDKNMILVRVLIKNIGKMPQVYQIGNFYLLDNSSGKTISPALLKVPDPIITTNVLPGKTLSGYLGFNVGKGKGKFTLVFQGATGNIEINIPNVEN